MANSHYMPAIMSKQYATEAEYLQHYNIHDYDIPLVSVDLGIFTLHEDRLKVLLVERSDHPEKGKWALPGGFVNTAQDKELANTALRKLKEKTGVETPYLEQLETIGSASRDPRGWSVTVIYFAMIPYVDLPSQHSSGENARWIEIDDAMHRTLAFDHNSLLEKAVERIRNKVLYTLIPAHLIPTPFTLTALQHAYEVILGREVEKKAFRRRMENADVLEPTGDIELGVPGRPAALYRVKTTIKVFNFSRQLSA